MVLAALGCMNNTNFENKKLANDYIVLDVFITCQKLRCTSNLKNILLVLIDLQSNPPKRPQSAVGKLF